MNGNYNTNRYTDQVIFKTNIYSKHYTLGKKALFEYQNLNPRRSSYFSCINFPEFRSATDYNSNGCPRGLLIPDTAPVTSPPATYAPPPTGAPGVQGPPGPKVGWPANFIQYYMENSQ